MTEQVNLEEFRERLHQLLTELEGNAAVRHASSETVELDQTRTGRLSRMDALQGQAMAKASAARAEHQILRIRAALRRLGDGSFGDCLVCEEPINPARLRADPAATICIDCAEKREQGVR